MSGKGVHFARMHQQEEEEEEAEQNSWGHEEEEGSEESSSDDEEVNKDSSVFSLLFQQCVKEGESAVDVNHLMGFIQKLQLGHKEGEEVYDSESASSMTYDLQTLRAMLDCNRDEENKIDEKKYLHIIRAWVEHVRESKNVPQSPQQEVPSVTDSPGSVMQDDPEVSYGSYGHNDSRTSDEASRRSSMRHETEETVAKLQYEIKCLNDRNNSLLRQYDGSEEMLRDFQSRNKVLQTKLDEAMGNLAKLKELEYVNTDLGKMLSDTRSMNEDLLRAKERLNREVEKMKTDFDHLECTLSTTRIERDQFHEQLKVTQTVLSQTKDEEREVRTELELKLDESKSHILLMTNDLEDAGSFNAELKATISELESQLHQLHTDQILTSTPFRRDDRALSLREEIEDKVKEAEFEGTMENGTESMENMVESPGEVSPGEEEEVRRTRRVETYESPEVESFKQRVDEKDTKIQTKTSLIMEELSGMLSPDVSSSSITTSLVSSTDDQTSIRLKLQGTLKDKVKLKKENKNLKRENSDLINRLQQLEVLLHDLKGTNGFGPAHRIPEYIDEEVSISHSSASEVLLSDASPFSITSSEALPKTTGSPYVQRSPYLQHRDDELASSTSPHHSQHSPARSSIQTSVIYTSAIQGAPIHTSTSSSDGLFSQPPPPTELTSELHVRHGQSPQGHSVVYQTNVQIHPQLYPPASQDDETPLHDISTSSATDYSDSSMNSDKVTSKARVQPSNQRVPTTENQIRDNVDQYSAGATNNEVPLHEPIASLAQTTAGRLAPEYNTLALGTSAPPTYAHTTAATVMSSTYMQTSVPIIHAQINTTTGTDVTATSAPSFGLMTYAQTSTHTNTWTTTGTEVPLTFTSPSVNMAQITRTSVETASAPGTFQPLVMVSPGSRSHPINTPIAEYQELAPRSLQFDTEHPSFIDSLEDVRNHSQEEEHRTKPIPTSRHRVYSKDPTSQVDGISLENSDLPLRTAKDDRSSRSTSPGRVFVTSKKDPGHARRSRISIDFEPSPSGRQRLLHKRSRSADPFMTDKATGISKFYPMATATPLSGEKAIRKDWHSLVLESEQGALQTGVVGVVNIRPGVCVNEETGAAEESRDVSSFTHVLPGIGEVDAPMLEKPETKEKGTSVNFERDASSQQDSKWPSLSSLLLNFLMLLFIIILILAFFVLVIISHDAVERCGTYCPHSPVHFLYATFEPYLQYTKINTPL